VKNFAVDFPKAELPTSPRISDEEVKRIISARERGIAAACGANFPDAHSFALGFALGLFLGFLLAVAVLFSVLHGGALW
jgi:hypothetical protein